MGEDTKTDMIKLDGSAIRQNGTEYQSRLFKNLELYPDDYSDIAFTPEQAQNIRRRLSHLSTGASAAVPLLCGGRSICPFADRCPFVMETIRSRKGNPDAPSLIPVGRQCLVEINLLNEWTRFYIQEYEIDEKNFTDFGMVRELAEIELMLWRLNNNLAKPENVTLVQDTIVGVDREGNMLTRKEVNALVEAKERFQNRKSKLVKLLVGDREGQWKREAGLKIRKQEDPSSAAANLRGQMEKLRKEADRMLLEQKRLDGDIIDVEVVADEEDAPLSPEDLIGKE